MPYTREDFAAYYAGEEDIFESDSESSEEYSESEYTFGEALSGFYTITYSDGTAISTLFEFSCGYFTGEPVNEEFRSNSFYGWYEDP